MNHMDTRDIDFFVANTVKQVFHANLDGSQKLKLLLVYDEVHRLLEKYGGSGDGFLQIERAAREFRKWGVGLILISQVLSDFVGTIKANIGTDIQMRTRDENDLERIKMKYGEDLMKSIVRASTGEAMFENAQYNKGKPYFVLFRPILHSTDRLSDEDLEKYNRYNTKIDDLKYQFGCLKSEAVDVFDLELELKLTSDNLMKGKFNMVDIYLEGLEPKVSAVWKKLGTEPKRRVVAYATRDEIQMDVEQARRDREDYIRSRKIEEEKQKKEKAALELKTKENENRGAIPEREREYAHQPEKHKRHELESIRAAVIREMRERAGRGSNYPKKNASARSGIEGEGERERKEKELMSLYELLKAKITESNKKGRDASLASIKAMSIPSDIRLALADNRPEELEKMKKKINDLLRKI